MCHNCTSIAEHHLREVTLFMKKQAYGTRIEAYRSSLHPSR